MVKYEYILNNYKSLFSSQKFHIPDLQASQDPSLFRTSTSSPPPPAPPLVHPHITRSRLCPFPSSLPEPKTGLALEPSPTWRTLWRAPPVSPLFGVEPDGPLTLIRYLHNQMLSTSSILTIPHLTMDTSCNLS